MAHRLASAIVARSSTFVLLVVASVACSGSSHGREGSAAQSAVGGGPAGQAGTNDSGSGAVAGTVTIQPAAAPDAGPPSRDVIDAVVRSHFGEIALCYRQELARRPGLAGRVLVEFVIEEDGRVYEAQVASSDLASDQVHECIVQAIRRWSFEEVPGEDRVVVRYPFVLSPGSARR